MRFLLFTSCDYEIRNSLSLFQAYPSVSSDRLPKAIDHLSKSCNVCEDPFITNLQSDILAYWSEVALKQFWKSGAAKETLDWFEKKSESLQGKFCATETRLISQFFTKALNRTLEISKVKDTPQEPHRDNKYSVSFRIPLTPLTIEAVGTADVQWSLSD